jgi:hypothetical protein
MNEIVRGEWEVCQAKVDDRSVYLRVPRERTKFQMPNGDRLNGAQFDKRGRLITDHHTPVSQCYGVMKAASRGTAMMRWVVVAGATGKTAPTFGNSTRGSWLGLLRQLRDQQRLSPSIRTVMFDQKFAEEHPEVVPFRRDTLKRWAAFGITSEEDYDVFNRQATMMVSFLERVHEPFMLACQRNPHPGQMALQVHRVVIAAHDALTWWKAGSTILKHTVSAGVARFYAERMMRWLSAQGDALTAAIVLTQLIPVIREWHRAQELTRHDDGNLTGWLPLLEDTKTGAWRWFREQFIPGCCRDAGLEGFGQCLPTWLRPLRVCLDSAFAELEDLLRFPLPCAGDSPVPSTVKGANPVDLHEFAGLKADMSVVLVTKEVWPVLEAWQVREVVGEDQAKSLLLPGATSGD